jgi:hypothetical protein
MRSLLVIVIWDTGFHQSLFFVNRCSLHHGSRLTVLQAKVLGSLMREAVA